ncbi:sulfatase-like hydrolase/transferase [Aestuariibaculum marinum]|uniref:Sulfatase-like hydrolase/transferase n=1 Tax=Aestuariibaculum marinum TaxID=2683592 RepID=A0A8J6Q457_9FLAO|nr:sulfatase-like hydrolase/transferase [Aestuariibaculum marinum]MBD0825180.1 sulfatase-like hydrolase/transferase [Aestuariibaculum marinum]
MASVFFGCKQKAEVINAEGRLVNSTKKPNIIMIFIDDMGWADLSSFGNTEAKTPNIDQLASEGMSFDQFYVNAPICSPSRIAITTGTYPQRWNITSYLSDRKHNAKRGIKNWLDPAAPTLARDLQAAGYATGHFGKWHMGGQRDVDEAPAITQYGFDKSLTNFEGMGPKLLPLTKDAKGNVGRIWEGAERLGDSYTWMQRSEITTGFIDAAMNFIDEKRNANQPFYVNIWPDDVHSPFWPPFEDYDLTKADGKRALYLAVLEAMDKQFGKLFNYVKSDKALRDNTLIVFCSDNGPEEGAGTSGDLRGFKGHLYEGGIRSSLIVWGPNFISKKARGTRNSDNYLSAIDLKPSLLKLSGIEKAEGTLTDGENLLGTLLGKTQTSRQEPIFWGRPPDRKKHGGKSLPDLAMREGDLKLLCDFDGGRPELYNLKEDAAETINLASQHPKIVEEMVMKVTAWYSKMPKISDME